MSITPLSNMFRELSLDSEYGKDMFYDNSHSSSHSSHEGEDSDDNCEDSTNNLDIPPSNIEKTINDPYLISFALELCAVASFQKTYYFNGADSYAIPHSVNHIQPASQNIVHILELWITEQLSHTGEAIPILGESTQTSAESIMSMLRETFALNGLAKVQINIRAGHVYSLHMIGDKIVMARNFERFFQQFPLFVNVSIKVLEYSPSVRHNTCQVLVAVEHVTMKDDIRGSENRNNIHTTCKFSNNARVISSPDGQTCCLLEEIVM